MEQGQEATEEDTQDIEETNPVTIVVVVIGSLPHSSIKTTISSSMEIASVTLIVTLDASIVQSLFTPSQLQVSLMEVSTTSSTKLQPSTSSVPKSS